MIRKGIAEIWIVTCTTENNSFPSSVFKSIGKGATEHTWAVYARYFMPVFHVKGAYPLG